MSGGRSSRLPYHLLPSNGRARRDLVVAVGEVKPQRQLDTGNAGRMFQMEELARRACGGTPALGDTLYAVLGSSNEHPFNWYVSFCAFL